MPARSFLLLPLAALLATGCGSGLRNRPIGELTDAEIKQVTGQLNSTETLYLMSSGYVLAPEERKALSIDELIDIGEELQGNDSLMNAIQKKMERREPVEEKRGR